MSDKKIPKIPQKILCMSCDYTTQSLRDYNKHVLTAKHIQRTMIESKIPENLLCTHCNYTTQSLKDYNKHILTAKHKRMTTSAENPKNPRKIPEQFICDCGKEYKYRQGLFGHKKKCNVVAPATEISTPSIVPELNVELFMGIIRENTEIKTMLVDQYRQSEMQQKQFIELQKENNHLMNKMVEFQLSVPSIVNNSTTNNQFNLNFFLNETCKDAMNLQEFIDNIKITFEELLTIGNAGFVNGVSDIFIKQLRDLEVTKRPIHCTDLKRETIYFKEEDSWNKDKNNEKLKNIIEKVEYKNVAALHQWCNENPDSKINNTDKNLLRDKIYLQTLQGDEATREKIIKNISKEVVVEK